jgi:undecaprenyl-diphosphatase
MLVAVGLFAALLAVAAGINSDPLSGIDTAVAEWFDAHRNRERNREDAGIFGYLGRPIHVLVVAAVCGALLSARARSAVPALSVVGGVGVGAAVEATLKSVIGRTATSGPLLHYPHTFPSGHVTGTAALLGMIAVCLGAGRGRAVKTALAVLVTCAVLFVAYLALYIGAHTFTDVIGGMLLGGAIVAAGSAVLAAAGRAASV